MGRDESWGAPPKTEVQLMRGQARVEPVPPGQERAELMRQLADVMGITSADLDRPLVDVTDGLGALECLALVEAIWNVELGPRAGTVSEIGGLVTGYPTLAALILAAEEAAKRAPSE